MFKQIEVNINKPLNDIIFDEQNLYFVTRDHIKINDFSFNSSLTKIYKLLDDQNIGFVYTDALIYFEKINMYSREFFNDNIVYDIPFFTRKNIFDDINTNSLLNIQSTLMTKGFFHHHIPEPMFIINHGS